MCKKADAARRLPWSPYWKFDLRGCTALYLAHAGLGPGGTEELATALRTSKNVVTELNLFNNSIGDAGAHKLAEVLEHNTVNINHIPPRHSRNLPVFIRALPCTAATHEITYGRL